MGVPTRSSKITIILVSVCCRDNEDKKNSEHAEDVGKMAQESRLGRRNII